MVGILDIAPPEVASETVTIRGTQIELKGIPASAWAMLLRRFPDLAKQMIDQAKEKAAIDAAVKAGKPPPAFPENAMPEYEAVILSMEMMPAVVAAGEGHAGDLEYEKKIAERLTLAEMSEAFAVVMRLSGPENAGIPQLPAGEDASNGAEAGKAPASTSRSRSKS